MLRLAATAYIILAPTLMGFFIMGVLILQMTNGPAITWAAVAGAVLALPVSWYAAVKFNKALRKSKG